MSPHPGPARGLLALASVFASASIALLGAGDEPRMSPVAREVRCAGTQPQGNAVVDGADGGDRRAPLAAAALDALRPPAPAPSCRGEPTPSTAPLRGLLSCIDDGDDSHDRVRDLRDAIRLAPPDAGGIAAMLRGPWRTETPARRLVQAMQLDGSPASIAALRIAGCDPTLPVVLRRRVLRALGDLASGPSPSLDLLWTVANDPATERGTAVAAMLAFGRAAAGLCATSPQQHATAIAMLDDALRTLRCPALADAARSALRTARP